MSARVKVRIRDQVKLGEAWLRPGDEPEVSAEEAAALEAAGALAADPEAGAAADDAPSVAAQAAGWTEEQFVAAVAEQAQRVAEAVFEPLLEEATKDLQQKFVALQEKLAAVEAERDEARSRLAERQPENADAPPVNSSTPQVATGGKAAARAARSARG